MRKPLLHPPGFHSPFFVKGMSTSEFVLQKLEELLDCESEHYPAEYGSINIQLLQASIMRFTVSVCGSPLDIHDDLVFRKGLCTKMSSLNREMHLE